MPLGIGEGLALQVQSTPEVSGTLPNPSDILSGKVKDPKTDNNVQSILTTALCYELKEAFDNDDDGNKKFDNS